MKYCDFSKAKVGDRVWSNRDGWLSIININYTSYPIDAVSSCGLRTSFTMEGKEHISDIHPAIFWNEFEIPKEAFVKPNPKLEVDTLVWVWDNCKSEKILRFFSHFNDGCIYTFCGGKDSSYKPSARISWNYWELYEPNEGLKDEFII